MTFSPWRAGGVENAADQRRADAAALERLGNLRMEDGKNAIGTLVIRERDVSVSIEFEAVAFGVVANVTGMVMSRSLHNHDLTVGRFPPSILQGVPWPISRSIMLRHRARPSRCGCWRKSASPTTSSSCRLSAGDNLKPDYLAINPMGKVPALRHGDTVITELAAICTYLADEFPDKKLNVPIGTPNRGAYLKWLFFGPGCLEPAVIDRAAPRKEEARRAMLGYGDFDTTMNVVAKAVEKGPWLMGEQFTAADVVIGANIRWGMMFKMVPERKEFVDYAARIAARPAAQRAEAKDKELGAKAA